MLEMLNSLTLWHWFSLGAGLIILDLLMGASFFLLWLGICAMVVGILLWMVPALTWEYQFLIFACGSVACLFFWRQYLKNSPTMSDKPRLNRRSEQYIGRTFTLTAAIENGRGSIKVDDSIWRIEGEDLPAGTKVKVTDVNGVVLNVVKLEE